MVGYTVNRQKKTWVYPVELRRPSTTPLNDVIIIVHMATHHKLNRPNQMQDGAVIINSATF